MNMPPWIDGATMKLPTSTAEKREHQIKSNFAKPSIAVQSSSIMHRKSSGSRISNDTCCSSRHTGSSCSSSSLTVVGSCCYRLRLRWLAGLVTLMTVLSMADAICDAERWWDPAQAECVPCTVCGEQQLVLRPCQEYMDTVCGTMKDLDMDLGQLARAENNNNNNHHEQRHWNEDRRHRRPDHLLHGQSHAGNGQTAQHQVSSRKKENTEEIMWDWQAASLLLAIIGCLLFFFAAAIIALNQTRQWRRIEKHFDADMEALSTQLMNHLSSMQQLENGSIFLDDVIGGGGGVGGGVGSHSISADQRRFRSGVGAAGLLGGGHHQHHHHHHHPIEVRCVYLDQLLDDKHTIQRQGAGNLYIEENSDRLSPIGVGGGGAGATVASGTTPQQPAAASTHQQQHHHHQPLVRMY
ncbi:tumor necrosis factor receptor superfamily member wengen [Sabethes cyaneus]|uniref:tumor necrosis factor receptor superfamily member wengen n=1 Tax=Sabethes cyaneus TaxID=53552 RepID=UPI00237EA806|nr:tumor necrosis factor receptor superfamily member wengen [Sabethes cyaneus]